MKKFFLSTASILALSGTIQAADLAPAYKATTYAPAGPPAWAGGYIGIQGGIARYDASFKDFDFSFVDGGTINGTATGGAFGGLVGYNFQRGNFVFGIEGDWTWLDVKTGQDAVRFINSTQTSFEVNWLATVRGRAGLAIDSTLVYVTGGVAFGDVKNQLGFVDFNAGGGFTPAFTQDETKVGWTAGVGVQHLFAKNWTARAEFRYVDLGTTKATCDSRILTFCAGYRGEFSNTLLMGLVGLDYKF